MRIPSIPVASGAAGQQNTLIETAVDYQAYEAGVTLEITPHIGEGNLLRLDIPLVGMLFRGVSRGTKASFRPIPSSRARSRRPQTPPKSSRRSDPPRVACTARTLA